MARALSQALTRASSPSFLSAKTPPVCSASRFVNHRNGSNRPEKKGNLVEVDLEREGEIEILGMKRLEEAIYRIIVKRSAPDWLPFIPGSSYWVPPRKRQIKFAEFIGKLANPLTDEEALSLMTARGWPSSSYFIEGSYQHTDKVESTSKSSSHSEDEEG